MLTPYCESKNNTSLLGLLDHPSCLHNKKRKKETHIDS